MQPVLPKRTVNRHQCDMNQSELSAGDSISISDVDDFMDISSDGDMSDTSTISDTSTLTESSSKDSSTLPYNTTTLSITRPDSDDNSMCVSLSDSNEEL